MVREGDKERDRCKVRNVVHRKRRRVESEMRAWREIGGMNRYRGHNQRWSGTLIKERHTLSEIEEHCKKSGDIGRGGTV